MNRTDLGGKGCSLGDFALGAGVSFGYLSFRISVFILVFFLVTGPITNFLGLYLYYFCSLSRSAALGEGFDLLSP